MMEPTYWAAIAAAIATIVAAIAGYLGVRYGAKHSARATVETAVTTAVSQIEQTRINAEVQAFERAQGIYESTIDQLVSANERIELRYAELDGNYGKVVTEIGKVRAAVRAHLIVCNIADGLRDL